MERYEGYDRIKKAYVDKAREARKRIIMFSQAKVGNPDFDAIPEMIKAAPLDVDFSIALVTLREIDQDEAVKKFVAETEGQLDNRPINIRLIRESDLPLNFQYAILCE
jgi:hypothetical protein